MTAGQVKDVLRKPDARSLAGLLGQPDFTPVYEEADRVRREQAGDVVHLRAILEFSNVCRRRCRYCGLNAENADVTRYRMTEEEIVDTARQAAQTAKDKLIM